MVQHYWRAKDGTFYVADFISEIWFVRPQGEDSNYLGMYETLDQAKEAYA